MWGQASEFTAIAVLEQTKLLDKDGYDLTFVTGHREPKIGAPPALHGIARIGMEI
jgi:hypothetical protein